MRILVVSDGRRGIENQALGLAEAVVRQLDDDSTVAIHTLSHSKAFSALPPSLQLTAKRNFGLPDADLVIGCGRQAIAPLIALRRTGHRAFTTFVQDPRTEPSRFNLVVAPDHDGLTGPTVETMIGSPNRVTRDRIVVGTLTEAKRLTPLPMPRALFAIGGPSKTHTLSQDTLTSHLRAAKDLHGRDYSLLITTSRRTPDSTLKAWQNFAQDRDHTWLHTPDSEGENPYFAFLGAADIILVTEDSTNMLTESCATGKPVYRLPMDGKPGKFQTLYSALEKRCAVRRWDGTLKATPYQPLDETTRIAKCLLERLS